MPINILSTLIVYNYMQTRAELWAPYFERAKSFDGLIIRGLGLPQDVVGIIYGIIFDINLAAMRREFIYDYISGCLETLENVWMLCIQMQDDKLKLFSLIIPDKITLYTYHINFGYSSIVITHGNYEWGKEEVKNIIRITAANFTFIDFKYGSVIYL